jgi:hypothetical protein
VSLSPAPRVRAFAERLRLRHSRLVKLSTEVRRLNDVNRALGERIVALEATPSAPPADTSRLGFLFVLTYGRSGSTLLQGVLNSLPGYLIRGENGGVLHRLQEFHSIMTQCSREHGPAAVVTDPWFGIGAYSEDRAYVALRRLALDLMLRPGADTRIVGYKEIRWVDPATEDLASLDAHVEFVRRVFPGARFVVNTRRIEDVARSSWWQGRPDAMNEISRLQDAIMGQVDALGDYAFHVHFDDYSADPSRLQGLFDWLGEPFDLDRVGRIFERRYSY